MGSVRRREDLEVVQMPPVERDQMDFVSPFERESIATMRKRFKLPVDEIVGD